MKGFSRTAATALAMTAAWCGVASAAEPVAPGGAEDRARRLVLLVQYTATDYSSAVRAGSVIDQAEYDEAVANVAHMLQLYDALAPGGPARPALDKLGQLVRARGPVVEVERVAGGLVPRLVNELGVIPVPQQMPSLERGAALYAQHCTSCHGAQGAGDGPAAAALKPPPVAFNTSTWADRVAPFQVFNTLSLGLDGTAMRSYAAELDEHDRWSLAFHVLTLRAPVSQRPPAPDPDLAPLLLAQNSNLALVAWLLRKPTPPTDDDAVARVDAARRRMPPPPTPAAALHAMARAADAARELATQGRRQDAHDVVVNAYLGDVELVEAALRRASPAAVSELEAAITALRAALQAPAADVNAAAARVATQARTMADAIPDVAPPDPAPPQPAEPSAGTEVAQGGTPGVDEADPEDHTVDRYFAAALALACGLLAALSAGRGKRASKGAGKASRVP